MAERGVIEKTGQWELGFEKNYAACEQDEIDLAALGLKHLM